MGDGAEYQGDMGAAFDVEFGVPAFEGGTAVGSIVLHGCPMPRGSVHR